MKPYLETFFRNPLLLILPALILPAIVFLGLRSMPKTYSVPATIWVDNSTTPPQTVQGQVQTASAQEAQALRERLSTLSFRVQMINDAQLTTTVDHGDWPKAAPPLSWLNHIPVASKLAKPLHVTKATEINEAWKRAVNKVQSSIQVKVDGGNLVTLTYTGPDPDIGRRLVQAAQANFLTEKAAATKRKIDETASIRDSIISGVQAETDDARKQFQDYRTTLSLTPTQPQSQHLADLQANYDDANSRLQQLKLNQSVTALHALTDWTDQSHSLLVVDGPVKPTMPAYGLKHTALLCMVGLLLGLVLGAMLVVARTWLVQTMRVTADVATRLGAPTVDTVPAIKIRNIRSGSW